MDEAQIHDVFDDEFTQRALNEQRIARLSYTGRDGGPRVIPIGYHYENYRFVVCTIPNSAKVPALRADPRVALSIDTDAFPPLVLLVRGTVEIEIVDGIPREYLEGGRGYISPEQFDEWSAQVHQLYDQMAKLTIVPTWAKILDFQTRAPSAVEQLARQKG